MVIVMKKSCNRQEIDAVIAVLERCGMGANLSTGAQTTVIGVLGDKTKLEGLNLELMDGVEKCVPIMHSYKLASHEMCPRGAPSRWAARVIGGCRMMAGPCAVSANRC
ncbi:MAG: hypothetical protein ACLSB9_11200 [Hydrogeniiclostridium mannosilyticum]